MAVKTKSNSSSRIVIPVVLTNKLNLIQAGAFVHSGSILSIIHQNEGRMCSVLYMHQNAKLRRITVQPEVGWSLMAFSAQTGYIVPWAYEIYTV